MLVSHSWCEEVSKEIIWEFENLLCNNDINYIFYIAIIP